MKKALILYGGWPWHYPEEMAQFTKDQILHDFAVELTDDLSFLESNRLHEFDVILPLWTQGELTHFQEQSLAKAVERGVGLATWHGIADAFNNNHLFKLVLGGQFRIHPGDFIHYEVNLDKEDSITKELSDFNMFSEQYYLHTDPGNEVIATTEIHGDSMTWLKGVKMPVAWKRQWGKGRVFYHALGHTPKEFELKELFELTRRGILWAAHAID